MSLSLGAPGLDRSASDAAVLEAVANARERLGRIADELDALRRRAADLALETAWRARAADDYRTGLARWRETTAELPARAASLDDELRHVIARIAARAGAP